MCAANLKCVVQKPYNMSQSDYPQKAWEGSERRTPTPMTRLVEAAVKEAMEEHEEKVKRHLDDRFDELKAIMLNAFPNGDPIGHKEFHQKQIEYMNDKIALWKEIRSKSIIGILWAGAGFLAMAVLEYVKRGMLK